MPGESEGNGQERRLLFDRSEKGSLYARAGIPEYWIANLVDGVVGVGALLP